MNNPSDDYVRPVHIRKRGSQAGELSILWFDPETKQVKMDPIDVADITLRDFQRIHSFFRHVQTMKLDKPNPQPNCTFKELERMEVFHTPLYLNATLRKVAEDAGEIVRGHVVMKGGQYLLQTGLVLVEPDTPVQRL